MEIDKEYETIQNIHIKYINYKALRKTKQVIKITNFKEYIMRYFSKNHKYYFLLCEKFNFNLNK